MGSLNFATQVPTGLSSVSKCARFTASRAFRGAIGSSANVALACRRGNGFSPMNVFSVDRFDASGSFPSATQAPEAVQKAAEADVMGLLLRQRIVFLGCSLDDFAADAIISQLLLLDAQDPTKDIRLFINSAGGSMRYSFVFKFWKQAGRIPNVHAHGMLNIFDEPTHQWGD